jgi:pSer/pThr/pTyr-binding forkhead associated (FHA) protein
MTILLKPHQGGSPLVLNKPILLFGRHPDCDVILKNSGKISRKHCCVALVDNRFVVRDLDSMNGVWVNSERVNHTASLKIGDELMIGNIAFTLTKHKEKEVVRKRPASERADATIAEIDPDDIPQSESFEHDASAARAASAALKERAAPANAGPSEGVEFSSAFAIPLPEEEDEDYVIPLADLDE